jgi:CTP:molybdopterin cytidylyltransferase MocA
MPRRPISTSAKAALSQILGKAAAKHRYVSLAWVRARMPEISPNTLRGYLSEAMANGEIHSAGRGWYSPIAERAGIDPEPVAALGKLLAKRFPLLPHALWSTAQINPWLEHTLGKETLFVNAPSEAVSDVAAFLRQSGWTVVVNPTKKSGADFVPGDKQVVLRGVRREVGEMTPERLLIELLLENRRLGILDEAERQAAARKWVTERRFDFGVFTKEIWDSKIKLHMLVGSPIEPTISEK